MKYKEWLDTWLNKYAKHLLKTRTFLNYERTIRNHITPFLGDYEMEDISPRVLQEYAIDQLEHGNLTNNQNLSVNTVWGIMAIIKKSLCHAVDMNIIPTQFTAAIRLPRPQEKQVTAFEKKEQQIIEQYCTLHKRKNYFGITLCLYTGIRLGELLALTWDDIDFEKRILSITKTSFTMHRDNQRVIIVDKPKTKNSTRVIPLPRSLVSILRKIKAKSHSKYVITTKTNGMVDHRSYQRTYERILHRIGIPYRNFHSLRHTFATRALELGMDVKTVSELLGHKNATITLARYAHSMMSYKTDMMNKLGKELTASIMVDQAN